MRRYCDDCVRRLPDSLPEFEKQEGKYSFEPKLNGYRLHLEFSEFGILPWSRKWKKHPISKEMAAILKEQLHFPNGTILDGEWMERRTKGPEAIVLWDTMFYSGEWVGDRSYRERMKLLEGVPNVWTEEFVQNFESLPGPILTVIQRLSAGCVQAFEQSKKILWTEGLVIKELDSTLIGSIKERTTNFAWSKVKCRGGSDGQKEGVQA
jgi:ATP-dependent DNA ligase